MNVITQARLQALQYMFGLGAVSSCVERVLGYVTAASVDSELTSINTTPQVSAPVQVINL